MAALRAQAADLRAQFTAASQALGVLLFDASGHDIQNRLVPAYLQACHELAAKKAELEGAGIAHHAMAEPLRAHGASVQALGTLTPERGISFAVAGFSIGNTGMPNLLKLDCSQATADARDEFLRRWSS